MKYILNESIDVSSTLNVTINFTCNGTNYTRFYIASSSLRYYRSTWSSIYAYRNGSWQGDYRTIDFTGTIPSNLQTWLDSNAIPYYEITSSVVGLGSTQIDRNGLEVTLTATPQSPNIFEKYEINGDIVTANPYTFTLEEDTEVITYFNEQVYNVEISTNVSGLSVYQSAYQVHSGDSVSLRIRQAEGYKFVRWSDGSTETERVITPTTNVKLQAIYEKKNVNETYYQFRGFIKDQLDMNGKPKAYVLVKSDKDKEDLLTKATSTISVQELPLNVNEGDVLVLYDPTGVIYYRGVISKIQDTKITCSQMASFFKGKFDKSAIQYLQTEYPEYCTSLEMEISALLQGYASGMYYGTTYTDTLIAQRLGGFTFQQTESQYVHLPTDKDKDGNDKHTQYDMEQFIYDMYADYGVVIEFEVNFEGNNYIRVFTPTYTQITIGNNQNAITDLSPITTVEETNKLIIFNSDGTYRTTYVARKDGEIVEEPTSTANRFEITNTKVVNSDDEDDILIGANLSTHAYNHKLTFSLLVENNLYDWHDFKLGTPLHIFIDGTFFDTVLTAREIIHNENQNIKQVNYTCGIVRVNITDLLNTKFGRGL